MSATITVQTTFQIINCANCGIGFGLPVHFDDKRREDHKSFYCPNGHSQYFPSESDAERFERLLKAQEQQTSRLNRLLTDEQNRLRATKGVVTKLRKRAITGTCAFCHRHFANVERHVATKHPGEQP